jgi:hypothetical protein
VSQIYAPGFAVQIAQLAILWDNLRSVDLWVVGEYVLPPFLLVHFLQMNVNELLVLCIPRQISGRVDDSDVLATNRLSKCFPPF